jgi:choline dehydrogenase-like flavoprotein
MLDNVNHGMDWCAGRRWDVIIVGTGMGGGTIGYSLARGGLRVLFCEMGRSHLTRPDAAVGEFVESLFDPPDVPRLEDSDLLARAGRYFGEIADVTASKVRRHIPFIGAGTGGSSALYGGALERLFPQDFEPRAQHPDASDSTLVESWPITYDELAPYYETAERLYRVRGGADPLRDGDLGGIFFEPPPISAGGRELFEHFESKGLHPYRLPQACEFVDGCEGCQGFLCPKDCKNDSARICIRPALESHGAALIDECEVVRLTAGNDAVTGVVCAHGGREVTLTSEIVVLAAGALETARLLLRSHSPAWSGGLANGSGLVGRNLMRHYVDLYPVQTNEREDLPGNQKELAFNDFYAAGEEKLGTVQSFGALPPSDVVLAEMRRDFRESRWGWLAPTFALAKPFIVPVLAGLGRRLVLASIMEDLPFEDNAVLPGEGSDRVAIRYQIHERERRRIELFRTRLAGVLEPLSFRVVKQAGNNQRIAHACGTCRFGDDPKASILDRWNRAHQVRNLYVVDSSFFPSSGGTNPALTIAANALRVADHVLNDRKPNDDRSVRTRGDDDARV